jgi:glyoxylase I family protein
METRYEFVSPDRRLIYVSLAHPPSGLVLCLVGHAENSGDAFSEFRTGLDHLEFRVDRRDGLDKWATRLDELGIAHSGVKTPPNTDNAMLTVRDPDNIQLEFFWRSPPK